MNQISSYLPYIQIVLAVVVIGLIIMQRTGSSVGGAFGGGDNFSSAFHTRRGIEKTLFNLTIVVAILFVASTLAAFLIK